MRPMAKQIVEHIARVFEFPSVALYDRNSGQIYRAGVDDMFDVDTQMQDVAVRSAFLREENKKLFVAPIRLGGPTNRQLGGSGSNPIGRGPSIPTYAGCDWAGASCFAGSRQPSRGCEAK